MGQVSVSIREPASRESGAGKSAARLARTVSTCRLLCSTGLLPTTPLTDLPTQHRVESQPGLHHVALGAKGICGMSGLSEAKRFAHDWIDQNRQRLSDFDLEIW